MFEINHYYKVTHSHTICIIKVRKYIPITEIWEIEIIKIFSNGYPNIYHEGLITNWFEEWCYAMVEIKNYEELVAYAL